MKAEQAVEGAQQKHSDLLDGCSPVCKDGQSDVFLRLEGLSATEVKVRRSLQL